MHADTEKGGSRYGLQVRGRLSAAHEMAVAKAERADAVSRIIVEVDGMAFDGDEDSQSRMGRMIAAAVAHGVDLKTEKRK